MDYTKDPNTQAPDQQSATGIVPATPLSQPSILDALKGMQTGPNPMLAGASGMLNTLGGGQPGANAYLQSNMVGQQQTNQMAVQGAQMAQQRAQFQQQQMLRAQQLQQRVNEMKLRQQQDVLGVATTLLGHESEEARMVGSKMMAETLKDMGRPEALPLVKALGTKKATPADLNEAYRDALRGLPLDQVSLRHPNLDTATLQSVLATKDSDDVRKMFGLETKTEQARHEVQDKINQAKLMEAQDPLFGKDPNARVALNMMHRELNNGRTYIEGTEESQRQAYQAWERKVEADKQRALAEAGKTQAAQLEKIGAQGDERLRVALATIQAKTAAADAKPPTIAEQRFNEQTLAFFENGHGMLKVAKQLQEQVDAMEKLGVLPKGEDVGSQGMAWLKRQSLYRNNPAVLKFMQMWTPWVTTIDRSALFDEKNVRFKQAFDKQIGMTDHLAPAGSMRDLLNTINGLILDRQQLRIKDMEKLGRRQEVIEAAKDVYGQWRPTDAVAQPKKAPPLPVSPKAGPLVGGKPNLRYNRATGTLEEVTE